MTPRKLLPALLGLLVLSPATVRPERARPTRSAPSAQTLDQRLRALQAAGDVGGEQARRILVGLRGSKAGDLRHIAAALDKAQAMGVIRRAPLRTKSTDYLHRDRGEKRQRIVNKDDDAMPPAPEALGLFQDRIWNGLPLDARTQALGIAKTPQGQLVGSVSRLLPNLAAPEVRMRVRHRRAPNYLAGLLPHVYPAAQAERLGKRLDQTLQPNPFGGRPLHADRATLVYPDTEVTPKGKPRYRSTLESLLRDEDVAFVFSQTYEFTDPTLLKLFQDVSKRAPVYAILGEADANHPVHQAWGPNGSSSVKWVKSDVDRQGAGRTFRIDHNKSLFVAKKDGSVFLIKTGMNNNAYSTQNIDIGVQLEGGNVALDVLGHMVRDYLRAGGRIDVADLARLRPALTRMIEAKPGPQAIPVEAAITSSEVAGKGRDFTAKELQAALHHRGPTTINASSLAALKAAPALEAAAARGKRLLVVDNAGGAAEAAYLAEARPRLEAAGVEIIKPNTIYVDNSLEHLTHRFVNLAAQGGERLVHAAFADSDGRLARRVIEASKSTQVDEIFSRLVIQGRDVNAANATRFLWSRHFRGTVTGVASVPGPVDERGAGRKFHMKALVAYKAASGQTPASGRLLVKSANDSVHGMRVNEESGLMISSPTLAKELMDFIDAAATKYGTRLKAPLPPASTALKDRPSLTRRVATRQTKLKDVLFVMGDWETSGFSAETDARPLEVAFKLYRLNDEGNGLVPVKAGSYGPLPIEFHRRLHLGNDHYGAEMTVSKDIAGLTGVKGAMVAYEPGSVQVMNELNRWIRLVEAQSGKVLLLGGHNMAAFDKRMHNDFNRFEGVDDNPFVDGDVFDTLAALRNLEPNEPASRKLFPAATRWANRLGQKLPSIRAHHAYDDTIMAATLGSMQLSAVAGKIGPLGERTWGEIRGTFVPKRDQAVEWQ